MKDDDLKRLDFTGWPLPDQYLIEVGRIAALWASLESFLNACLGKLAGFNDRSDPKPFILVNHASFPQKLDMLGALCELLVPHYPALQGYESTISALRSAQKHRNVFMHQGMIQNPETGKLEMASGSARGTLKFKTETVSIEDIKRVSIKINEAQRALYKLVLQRDIPAPWQKPPKKQDTGTKDDS